jgi:hypothetical protein
VLQGVYLHSDSRTKTTVLPSNIYLYGTAKNNAAPSTAQSKMSLHELREAPFIGLAPPLRIINTN